MRGDGIVITVTPAPPEPDRDSAGRVFVFAGGGTGGHLFPALAIAEHLRLIDPRTRCVFLCSRRPLDADILRQAGVSFAPIPALPLGLRPPALARFIGSWGGAVRAARSAIRGARRGGTTVELVAMGGFVSAPAARAARAERVPVTLVNLDAVPGKANRWVARGARRVLTATPVAGRSWMLVGPIVRPAALAPAPSGACRRHFGLDPGIPTLLVTGASQGARSINDLLIRLADQGALAGWQVIHQTGAGDRDRVSAAYARSGVAAAVHEFVADMGRAWGAADLAVSRAGAGSVAEAWANGVPAVFLPYPHHRDGHQRENAAVLSRVGAAVVAEDAIDAEANAEGAGRIIRDLARDAGRREAMRAAFASLGRADGAARAAHILLGVSGPA